jgi:hypothetical protein
MIGVSLEYTDTSPSFAVGTVVNLSDGGQAIYVQAASTCAEWSAVTVNVNNTVAPLTTTNSANSKAVGFAQVSIASSAVSRTSRCSPPQPQGRLTTLR